MAKSFVPEGKNSTSFNPQLLHFDWICGQVVNENKILKKIIIIACLSFFVSISVTFYAVNQPDSIPVLITMNDFGETTYIGPVSRKNYQNFKVPEIAIHAQVKHFILLINNLSSDRIVMKKSVASVYHLLTSDSAGKFNAMLRENNPYEGFGEKTKEVFFDTEPMQLSSDSFQIDYSVETRSLSGNLLKNDRFRAIVSIKLLQPEDKDIYDNPLGIYVTSFDIKPLKIN